jgi:hypothetical protein
VTIDANTFRRAVIIANVKDYERVAYEIRSLQSELERIDHAWRLKRASVIRKLEIRQEKLKELRS